MQKKERLDYIDCAKGIGILLVVVAHHLQDMEGVCWWIYSFHMPLFFVITGYLYADRTKTATIKEAIFSGAKSLLYPYCIMSIILILWWIIFGAIMHTVPEEPIKNIIIYSLSTYGYHALWFLPTMFAVSVSSKAYTARKRWGLLAVSIVSGCFLSYLANTNQWCPGYWRYVVIYFGRFFLALSFVESGRYIHGFIQKISGTIEWIVLAVSLGISLLLHRENILVSMAFSRIGNPIIYYVTAYAGSLSIFLLGKKISGNRVGQKFRFWGKNTLIVMALHMDITIEIAWIVLGITKLYKLVSFKIASIMAILIELVLLYCIIQIINRYAAFLVHFPQRKENAVMTEER